MNAQLDQSLSIDPADSRPDFPHGIVGTLRRAWSLRWPAAAISHHAKIIYFPVPKAGNTAMLTALTEVERRAGLEPRFTDPRTGEPSCLEWIRPRGRAEWSAVYAFNRGYRKIAVVRNPWHRLVSCYCDKVRWSEDADHVNRNEVYDGLAVYNRLLGCRVFQPEMTFEMFVRIVCRIPDVAADPHFRSQVSRFHTPRGDLLIDELIRLEDDKAFGTLFARHDVEFRPVRQTFKGDWEQFYTPELAAKVRKRYARDVMMLGYGAGWWSDPTNGRRG